MSKDQKILVTGGAGYIGSFTVKALKKAGYQPIVFDSLETGHKEAIGKTKLYVGDLKTDFTLLDRVFKEEKPGVVIHFAAFIQAGESMENPGMYFRNNILGSLNLLEACKNNKVNKIVFSSTAAVYGDPQKLPIPENHPQLPTNVYGETKVTIEKLLFWYHEIHRLSSISIRYFNAAGGALDGEIGEEHKNESHIIPLAIRAAQNKSEFTIFGDNYPTKDGTCIRDYIHVLDLVEAHILALNALKKGFIYETYNAGSGRGYSNYEVVKMVKKVVGDFPVKIGPRRKGDSLELVADSAKIKKSLGWEPRYSDLETIIKTAWLWHQRHPNGYGHKRRD